jgi:pimeloyl-ACP methyl ester carboxylesterase
MKVLINNLTTEYRDEGEGKVVLMLHGWWRNLSDFDKITEILRNNYRIVRVDLPGFGGTERPKTTWCTEDYVDFVNNFIEKINIRPEVLIGHSFGGRIIIKGAGENKFQASKVVLIAAAGVQVCNWRKKLFFVLAKIGDIVSYIPPLIFIRRKLKNKFYKVIGSDYLESGNMKDIFKVVVEEDLTDFAKQIKTNSLLIWGDKDIQTQIKDGQLLHSLITNSKMEIIPNSGHFIHIEESQKVANIIKDFIK